MILVLNAIINPHIPILRSEKIVRIESFIIIPDIVPYMLILAFPIACSVLARGLWMYCNKNIGAKNLI